MLERVSRFFQWFRALPDYVRYRMAQKEHRKKARERDKDMYPLW